jgi:hypothetical protein
MTLPSDAPEEVAAWIMETFRAWSDGSGDIERGCPKDARHFPGAGFVGPPGPLSIHPATPLAQPTRASLRGTRARDWRGMGPGRERPPPTCVRLLTTHHADIRRRAERHTRRRRRAAGRIDFDIIHIDDASRIVAIQS